MTIKRRSSARISTTSLKATAGSSNDKQQQRSAKKQKRSSTATKKSHWSRPGVEAAARLVSLPISSSSSDHDEANLKSWNTALSYYESTIKAKGDTKLYNLDQQRQLLARQWRDSDNGYNSQDNNDEQCSSSMTKDQLLNVIIPWKFGKGKPRNALKPLLQSNKEGDVIEASMLAFNFAESSIANNDNDDGDVHHYIQEAIKSLCQLSGVGPATASAVLSAYCPQSFAFMDDEVIECLYEAKRGYTLKIYMAVNDRCVDIAEQLNEASCSGSDGSGGNTSEWTPADVAKALWTVATMSARNDEVGLGKVFCD
eukprot:CAMPEP_0201726274 /NCGR_PEP_ID=MMETSP0593-20130828/9357_1 /ASSEMBLY_ACC=CAM_ASM_000672 /TAXON_ID=267983 /ORGANISM="Skeletonema japonicum, Strain CCMP2506" /LENGTH=311 /DNA_ID=CAMNT_0048217747 /DNA_START=38 /DNA_END=973 /DNA_ORIENTATION=-